MINWFRKLFGIKSYQLGYQSPLTVKVKGPDYIRWFDEKHSLKMAKYLKSQMSYIYPDSTYHLREVE